MLPPYQQMLQARLLGLMGGAANGAIAPLMPSIAGATSPATGGARVVQGAPAPQMPQADVPDMPAGVPEDPMTRVRQMRAQYMQGADGIDPRIAAILDRRASRLDEQEKALGSKRGSVSDALLAAGNALAQSRSPRFAPALSLGVTAAADAIDRRREEMMKRRLGIQDARDELEMQRIQQEGAGRRAAIEQMKADLAMAADLTKQDKDAAEVKLKRLELEQSPQKFAADLAKMRAELGLTNARIATERAQQANYYDTIRDRRAGEGAGTKLSPFQQRAEMILRTLGPTAYQQFLATGKADINASPGNALALIGDAREALKKASNGGISAYKTAAANLFGIGTDAAAADETLNTIQAQMMQAIPKFKGSDSDKDVRIYMQSVGAVGDATKPRSVREAALEQAEKAMKRLEKRGLLSGEQGGSFSSSGPVTVGGYTFPNKAAADAFKRKAGIP